MRYAACPPGQAAELTELIARLAAELRYRRRKGDRRTDMTITREILIDIGMPGLSCPIEGLREMALVRAWDAPAASPGRKRAAPIAVLREKRRPGT
jgi:hypothetical protein